MFLPEKREEDEAEDRNAAKLQLKKALCRAYRRRSRAYGWLTHSLFQIPRVRCVAPVFLS